MLLNHRHTKIVDLASTTHCAMWLYKTAQEEGFNGKHSAKAKAKPDRKRSKSGGSKKKKKKKAQRGLLHLLIWSCNVPKTLYGL